MRRTELRRVLGVDTTTVDDSGRVGNGLGDLGLEPFTDIGVDLLRLLDGSDLASTNSPDWLVYSSVFVFDFVLVNIQAMTTFLHDVSFKRHLVQPATTITAAAAREKALTSSPPP